MTTSSLSLALDAWTKTIQAGQVLGEADALATYGNCTMGARRRLLGAVKPVPTNSSAENPAEIVRRILQIANEFRVPIYPISTGRNWGYGSALPVESDCVVVDMSGFNRIADFDPLLGLVTVEPGVTQEGLARFLELQGSKFLVPVTGGGPTCSILGNALERGYGITPYADHFAAVTCLEAVLADGTLYRSALSQIGGTAVDRAHKWGTGPYLDGLFAQGNFGVVTRMTIALARRPPCIEGFFFKVSNDAQLPPAVGRIQLLLQQLGGTVGAINLMNRRRVVAMMHPFQHNRIDRDGLLAEEYLVEVTRQTKIGAWTGFGALYGEPSMVSAARQIVRQTMRGYVTNLMFVSRRRAEGMRRFARSMLGPKSRFTGIANKLCDSLDIVEGKPSRVALPLAYWKSNKFPLDETSPDPAKDGCGLIWFPPLVEMRSKSVQTYIEIVTRICRSHGIEPLITLTTLSDRCFDSSVPLLFDKSNDIERTRAIECYWDLFESCKAHGFIPYRLNIESMGRAVSETQSYWSTVGRIKRALDPENILAPGRYSPVATEE